MEAKYYSRKEFLRTSGLGLISIPAIASTVACQSTAKSGKEQANDNQPDCVLAPESVEGPYYIPGALVRNDIRENKPGLDLKLYLKVVNAADCTPIPNAVVDIWHCDAEGYYSSFTGYDPTTGRGPAGPIKRTDEEVFLRGVQVTDAQGEASFLTIYPGWYTGRAIHIHFKVFLNQNALVTSQIYFPQELNEKIHRESEPYNKRGPLPHSNEKDGIARRAGIDKTLVRMSETENKLVGRVTLGIAS